MLYNINKIGRDEKMKQDVLRICLLYTSGEGTRITVLHHNIPNMLGQFTTLLAEENLNIALMSNKSRNEYAYTMMDVDADVPADLMEKFGSIEGVLKVRIIQ